MFNGSRRKRNKNYWSNYNLNPRGNQWSEDENSRGQKLLKQMGWNAGDGLGKNGTGIKEPIRVVQSRNCNGLGFKQLEATNNWLSNQVDFDSVLSSLQVQHASSSKDKQETISTSENLQALPLEQKSKGSRHRVHYHRAIRSKDMSQRSQSDWECVLGRKRKLKCDAPFQEHVSEVETVLGINSTLNYISTVNSETYFLEKKIKWGIAARIESSEVNGSESNKTWCKEEINSMEETEISEQPKSEKKKRKKKKKNRKLQEDGDPKLSEDRPSAVEVCSVEKENVDSSVNRKKKRKKKFSQRTNTETIEITGSCSECRETRAEEPHAYLSTSLEIEKVKRKNNLIGCLKRKEWSEVSQMIIKKHVRFVEEPLVSYVPSHDSGRGGAWVWKKKNKEKKKRKL